MCAAHPIPHMAFFPLFSILMQKPILEMGIRLQIPAAGVHNRIIERQIQEVQNRFRSTLFGLPYTLPISFHIRLYFHVIKSMNITPNIKTNPRLPKSIITGTTEDGQDLEVPFGKVGYFHNRESSGLEPRSFFGIYLGRISETHTILVYNTNTRRVVSRDVFREIQISQTHIDLINDISKHQQQLQNDDSLILGTSSSLLTSTSFKFKSTNRYRRGRKLEHSVGADWCVRVE